MSESVSFFDGANFSVPTVNRECDEVFWSDGRSCLHCPMKLCYRYGWKKKDVLDDVKRLYSNQEMRKASA